MEVIDINQLTAEQRKALADQFAQEQKDMKVKRAQNKELLKNMENDVVMSQIDFFVDKRDDIESRIVKLFADIEPLVELRAECYGNEKRSQDSHTFTLDEGEASIRVGWNVKPSFNGTESEGIVKIKAYMSSLAGESENEQTLMEFLNIALKTDAQGNYDPKKVRELNKMRKKANSELFDEGMDIIDDAMIDVKSSKYVRGYKMVEFESGVFKRVNFNFSID